MQDTIIDTHTLHKYCHTVPSILPFHGKIHATAVTRQKVDKSIFLPIIEPELEDIELAMQKEPNLAFCSWVALFTAKRKGYAVITDSALLRKECIDEHVPAVNSVELLHQLYSESAVTLDIATDISRKMNIEKEFKEAIYAKPAT